MVKYCCASCFGDNGLKKNIIPSLSPDFGDCSYCGTKGIEIIEPHALFDHFEFIDKHLRKSSGWYESSCTFERGLEAIFTSSFR